MEKHPLHLKIPDLQTSEDVVEAVEKQERLTEERVPNNPNDRIEAYMDRLENIFLNENKDVRERNIEMLREPIYDAFIIKPENVPESYFELQKRIAAERGQHVEEIPQDARDQMIDVIIKDQKASLDSWIDYLTSDDAVYPTWFKYFAFRNVIKLSQFDKELGKFKERTDSTTAPFPDIYREPLAQICDAYERVASDNKALKEPEVRELFSKKFPSIYAELIQKSLAAQFENREGTNGEWIKYEQGNDEDAQALFESLDGKGTGWCTAGKSTAETQINSGDFYVYYTYDKAGKPTQPRIAIRMEGEHIGEVRGILPHQALEPQMSEALDAKLTEFGPEADRYKKKSHDMKLMTDLATKQEKGEVFTQSELSFLYELDSKIEGFGYSKDPRIEELRSKRDTIKDVPVIFGCALKEIAQKPEEVDENTKAYIGPLFPGVFKLNLDHVYTAFPEGKIQKYETTIGGKTKDELVSELQQKDIYVADWAKDLLNSKDFETSKSAEELDLVRVSVGDLGFPNGATTDQIYARASEFGLELCPAEVGPHLRLQSDISDYTYIAMKQIAAASRDGSPLVFDLRRDGAELELNADSAKPSHRWGADDQFIFRLRKDS